jgi:predicted amidophosphoribosyltransferase
MTSHPDTCSNCGTENRPSADFCSECGQPLTQSAESGVREQMQAQEEGGVFGIGDSDGDAGEPNVGGGADQRRTGV